MRLLLTVSTIAILASCTTLRAENCPIQDVNPGAGITLAAVCSDPQQGEPGVNGTNGTNGTDGQDGADGTNGVDGKDGRDGKDFDMDKALALNSALSMPVWLGDSERVRISGGLGFSEGGETAFGATGVVRLDKNWAGFVGGAVDSEGGSYAGKLGVSLGW